MNIIYFYTKLLYSYPTQPKVMLFISSTDCRHCPALSLPLFSFVMGEVLPATSSPPHLIVFSTLLSLVFFFQSASSPAFLTSLFTQSSHISLGLPRLLLPSSRNSAALFGSLSSAILSTYPTWPIHIVLWLLSSLIVMLCLLKPDFHLIVWLTYSPHCVRSGVAVWHWEEHEGDSHCSVVFAHPWCYVHSGIAVWPYCYVVFTQAWLCDIEKNMRVTLKEQLKSAKNSLRRMLSKRDKWVKEYPGQVSNPRKNFNPRTKCAFTRPILSADIVTAFNI